MKGLSPECQRKWARRWDVLPYTLPHPGMWQMCCFFFPILEPLKVYSFKTVLEKKSNLAVRTGFVPLHQHVHYLPPASLQLGQVQATLRSLFPSRPVPSLSSSTNRTCRCDKSLVFRVEFDQSSDSGSSLIWIPAQTERGQSFKKRPQNNQESPQNETATQYIYKKVFQD